MASTDLEGQKTLTSPEFARVNLLKVSVSENFLSQFLGQEKKEMKIDGDRLKLQNSLLFLYKAQKSE